MINVNYQKRKNLELFKCLEKSETLFLSNAQNYIPIYNKFFTLNDSNYNSINLNNKWYISNVNDGGEDEFNLFNCRLKNVQNNKVKDKDVFFKKYKSMGYHSIGLSNYQFISHDFAEENGFVPCYEHGYNVWKRHHVCIGAQHVVWLDFIWGQSLHHKQTMINILKPTVQVLALAHPKFRNSFEPEDFVYLSNYDCIEVLNHYRTSDIHWDSALSNGHKAWIVADDDTHNVLDSGETGVCWTMIYAPNNGNQQEITTALKNGQAFGVQGKQGKMDIFPKLIHLTDSIYSITMMDTVESITMIGQNGKKLAVTLNSNHLDYILKKTDTYIRAIIKTPQTSLWLNPILRDSQTPIPQKNDLQTLLYRLLWLIGYTIIIVFVWKKKNRKKHS